MDVYTCEVLCKSISQYFDLRAVVVMMLVL